MPVREPPLVELRKVEFSYRPGERRILSGLDMSFHRGKVVAIMGSSGCGKTTVLRLIGGQIKASQGLVSFAGADVGRLDVKGIYAARRRMGMLFQFGALFTDMSVYDNVAFPLREHSGLSEDMIRDLVMMKLNAVGLRGAHALKPGEVSGGMARRVALARAIALDPELLMYDEPFTGLDPISMGITARLIRRLNDALGATSILVTHDIAESFAIADYIYFMANGRVVVGGTPMEINASTDPMVRQFFDAEPDGPAPFHYPSGATLACDFGPPEAQAEEQAQ
ncbi:MAG: ABC transporter ATP-binding protein [Candidatus Protistobacter heckmanni]|nr:ABC transporter ATP-binding protein [Candidatus Protistobacter heckmanni]